MIYLNNQVFNQFFGITIFSALLRSIQMKIDFHLPTSGGRPSPLDLLIANKKHHTRIAKPLAMGVLYALNLMYATSC